MTREPQVVEAFLLNREWRDRDGGVELVLWARSKDHPVRVRLTGIEAVMFVPRGAHAQADRRAERPLTTLKGVPVDALYFRSQRGMLAERDRIRASGSAVFESDVKPHERYLMERFVTAAIQIRGSASLRDGVLHFDNPTIHPSESEVPLSIVSLDLETDSFDGPILSAALAMRDFSRIIVSGSGMDHDDIHFVPNERALLTELFAEIRRLDPDIIVGWNVVDFDFMVLEKRAQLSQVELAIGRGGESARMLVGNPNQPTIAKVAGRVVLDGIATLKSATHRFERFNLEHVSQEVLGRGKRISKNVDPVAEIRRMHAEDVDALAAYNLEDCRLVLDIFEKLDLLGFLRERARLTGLPMDRQGGSVAAFDHLYLPRLHRHGVVAPDVDHDVDVISSPGGFVLDSVPGLYRNVLSFDFRSLYPSIIRTFRIDPLGLFKPGENPLPGEDGATFARDPAQTILPALIETLHEARSKAIANGNEALSRAIKILMNSFYGVLGTPGCRFFDARLPTSITRRGHAVIERARSFFAEQGLPVLYGDTDSLFVHVQGEHDEETFKSRGRALAAELTRLLAQEIERDFGVESRLELKFESHFLRFLMPTIRGTSKGSKKRYAGWVRGKDGQGSLVIRGLEAIRTDWTPLARRVQRELLRRVFNDEAYEPWLRDLAAKLSRGELDEELVYRKYLRQSLSEYSDESAPPHVRAARLRTDGSQRENVVSYVVTTRGPEPISNRASPMDYTHYLKAQLEPACDVVLTMLGTSFDRLAGVQQSLF